MDNQCLRELRMEAGKTQAEVAAFLGCHREVYRRYETGSSPVRVRVVIKLAGYYGTSVDYLLGLSQQRQPY